MDRMWNSPGHYVQGPGLLTQIKNYANIYGETTLYITDSFMYPTIAPMISSCYECESNYMIAVFDGEISRNNINNFLNKNTGDHKFQTVVGIGGGKVIDTAKVIAMTMESALIVCPTTASCDAPTSAMSILYSDEGEMNEIMIHKRNPDLVLVDTQIVLTAPSRFLIAGMGDALSTYYEGMSNEKTGHANYVWCDRETGMATIAGKAVAKACIDTLYRDGQNALIAAQAKSLSPQFENVVEANILLSGLGFENVGCSIAHAIGNAFTAVPEGEQKMHGERVGFGTLCLLIAEEYPQEEIEKAFRFCVQIGIPVSLKDLNIPDEEETLRRIAKSSLTADSWNATPYEATEDKIVQLLRATSAIGEYFKMK